MGKDSPCPVCTRPLGQHYESVHAHFEQEIRRLRKEWKGLNEKVQDLKAKIGAAEEERKQLLQQRDQLREDLASFENERKNLAEAQNRQKKFQQKVDELQQQIDEIGEIEFDPAEYEALLERYAGLQKIREHALRLEAMVGREAEVEQKQQVLEQQQAQLLQEMTRSQQQLEALGFEEKAYTQAMDAYKGSLEHLNQLRNSLLEAGKALAAAQSRVQNLQEEIQRTKQQLEKAAEIKQEMLYFQALTEHLGQFRLRLASRLRPLIAARASELLRLTTSGRYSLLELDEDYNISLYDQGQVFPLHRFSGGEQDLANLCLRVAISQVVAERSGKAPVKFIVLDEIFGSQDVQRQNLILQALLQLQAHFRQIFIISHVETIKEVLPVIVQVEMTHALESRARVL